MKYFSLQQIPSSWLAGVALIVAALLSVQGSLLRARGGVSDCVAHWLFCNLAPLANGHSSTQLLDGGHRLLSLICLMALLWLMRRAWKERQANPGLWYGSSISLGLFVLASVLGVYTVASGLTTDVSLARGILLALHLLNSALLISALCISLAYAKQRGLTWPEFDRDSSLGLVMMLGFAVLLLLSFSGALTAMGNTLEINGQQTDSAMLLRLRMLHPIIGLGAGMFLLVSLGFIRYLKPIPQARPYLQALLLILFVQALIGTGNLTFLGSVALQLLHSSLALGSFGLLSVFCFYTLAYSSTSTNTVFSKRALRPAKDA